MSSPPRRINFKLAPVALIHADHEKPGLIGELSLQLGARLESVNLHRGEKPSRNIRDYSHLVIMGGPMNVYEENSYQFLKYENALISEAIDAGMPVLGICLGAQLIAKALGAKVKSSNSTEIGWFDVSLTRDGKSDPAFASFPDTFKVFQWHSDTFDLPERAKLVAHGENVENQAFALQSNVYALQFHLEVSREMVAEWFDINRGEIESLKGKDSFCRDSFCQVDPHEVIAETDVHIAAANELCKLFCEKFFSLAT